jgi:6-phospho-beta-glucosidase
VAETGIRVAVVGGGSSYTPELIEGFLTHSDLPIERVTLLDVVAGQDKQRIVAGLAQRMVAKAGRRIRIDETLDRETAISGADFVCAQYRVGGLAARSRDESVPLRYGRIGQETVGAGGFANAYRTIPVAVELLRDVERWAPDAWVLNFTNPSGMVTEALQRSGFARVIGLCNAPMVMQRLIAQGLGVDPDRVRLAMYGLNHFSFAHAVWVDEVNQIDGVLEGWLEQGAWPDGPTFSDALKDILRHLRVLPNGYLRYYWQPDQLLAEEQQALANGRGTRATEVMAIEADLFRRYQDEDLAEKPPELARRGGAFYSAVAVDALEAIALDRRRPMVLNVVNQGAMPDLPADAVVEVSCHIDGRGPKPEPQPPAPPFLRGWLAAMKAYETLTVEAALRRDRTLAVEALALNPLVASVDVAEKILTDMWGGRP